uniref:Uncharacterized protein n=1 Tax=Rangifer tarandus platyrhynchus TaxID=3082113 RepID=A0ACB0DR60_RANTA|nr:unnamed protein product [Rangifer tarandus platyrhynchus]
MNRPIGLQSNFKRHCFLLPTKLRCSSPGTGFLTAHGAELVSTSLQCCKTTPPPPLAPQRESRSARQPGSGDLCESALRPRAARAPAPCAQRGAGRVLDTPLLLEAAYEAPSRVQLPTTPRGLKSPQQQAHPYPPCQRFSPLNFPTLEEALVPKEQQGPASTTGVTARLGRSGRGGKSAGTRPVANPLDHGGKGEPDRSYLLLRLEVGKMDAELVTLV